MGLEFRLPPEVPSKVWPAVQPASLCGLSWSTCEPRSNLPISSACSLDPGAAFPGYIPPVRGMTGRFGRQFRNRITCLWRGPIICLSPGRGRQKHAAADRRSHCGAAPPNSPATGHSGQRGPPAAVPKPQFRGAGRSLGAALCDLWCPALLTY